MFLASSVLVYIGMHFLGEALFHKGAGVWHFGGDEPGTNGMISTDEFSAVISQSQYRRECLVNAIISLILGIPLMVESIKRWRKKDDLERSWANFLFYPDNRQDVEKRPHLFTDEFLEHVKEANSKPISPPDGAG